MYRDSFPWFKCLIFVLDRMDFLKGKMKPFCRFHCVGIEKFCVGSALSILSNVSLRLFKNRKEVAML